MHDVRTPIWCIVTFAPGVFENHEVAFCAPPAFDQSDIAFGYIYDASNKKNKWFVHEEGIGYWRLDLTALSVKNEE